jgi:hypothetical protein
VFGNDKFATQKCLKEEVVIACDWEVVNDMRRIKRLRIM